MLIPDLLHYFLCGELANERTNASTGAWLTADGSDWDHELLDSLNMPQSAFGRIIDPGTKLGCLRPEIAQQLDLPGDVEVVAPATHDTASAIAAVPAVDAETGTWAYLSSGTWSLLGAELSSSIRTPEVLHDGFTNELGVPVDGKPTVRFLRNIGGLWLIQELRRDLAKQGKEYTFAELADLAESAASFQTVIDPNAADLATPGGIIEKLRRQAESTGQPTPETPGQLARCCLESLALCYASTIERLERYTGSKIKTLHIVGGGAKNALLNRLTANACGRRVLVGPTEATSIGNLLVQAMGLGIVADLAELRAIVGRSFSVEAIEPTPNTEWTEQRTRFAALTA